MRPFCASRYLWALLVVVPLTVSSAAYALNQQHLDYDGCFTCHGLHGAPSQTLVPQNPLATETLCLSCHGPAGVATRKAMVHNLHPADPPLEIGDQGYITCRECHDAHEYVGTTNIMMVGSNWDPEVDPSKQNKFTTPTVRYETTTTSLASPVYRSVTFQDDTDGTADFNIDGTFPGPGICQACHSPNHNVGKNCMTCHSHDKGFAAAGCTGCHVGSGGGALNVSVSSPHSLNDTGYTCEECHTGHGSGTIEIPNNSAVGILYTLNGESGIALGSATATGATEAEICWNCHAGHAVSEWGTDGDPTNSATRPPNGNDYDFGSLYSDAGTTTPTANWVGAWWKSGTAKFGYKTGQIQSTHSVNGAVTDPGSDAVGQIRCSYCHDVHELALAPGDTATGKPYLRGTWRGNPYREDGAPQVGDTWTTNGNFGAVPRGGTQATQEGGYQIDQNNGNPTVGWTADDSSGLCELCHGTGDGTWAVATVDGNGDNEIDRINKFGTPSTDWIGTNGHSGAVLGGTGNRAVNIFREDWRKPNDGYCNPSTGTDADGIPADADGYCAGYPNMAYQQLSVSSKQGWGFRGYPANGEGFLVEPSMTQSQPYAYRVFNWGVTVNDATTDSAYHKFSCSKCHNPHASRLPRLMITNCLDVRHNTWDDSKKTMTKEDTSTNTVLWTRTGGTYPQTSANFNIEYFDINTNLLYVPSSVFGSSYSNNSFAYTITWNGQTFTLASRGAIVNNASVTLYGTSYTFDTIKIDSAWVADWTGMWIPSRFTPNDDGSLGSSRIKVDNSGKQVSYASSAQNCHRYVDANGDGDGTDAGDQRGWNKVTPWR